MRYIYFVPIHMDITLVQIRAFLTVARLKSFTVAARVLHISQPALTVQIQQLEAVLNLRLLDRNTHSVSLTPAGHRLLPKLRSILYELEAVLASGRDLAAPSHGIVGLACIPSIASTWLPDAIACFRNEHPQASFDLRDTNGRRVIPLVRSGEVEIGITNSSEKCSDLDEIELCRERMRVIFPKSHPIADLQEIPLDRIADYPLILLDTELNSRVLLDSEFSALGRRVHPVCEVALPSAAIGMVRAGLGIALLAPFVIMANHLETYPELRHRPIDNSHLVLCIRVIYKKDLSLSPFAQAFLDLLRESAREIARKLLVLDQCSPLETTHLAPT
ncbi:MAG: LysR family transcriptional regulator [Candidatus Acidiferrales bacterium]